MTVDSMHFEVLHADSRRVHLLKLRRVEPSPSISDAADTLIR